jgi:hypothetical protein
MTDLDTDVPHVLTAAHQVPFTGTWIGFCTCGTEFVKASAEEVREAGRPHRLAERERLSRVENGGSEVRKRPRRRVI